VTRRQQLGVVPGLALLHLRYEWVLSLCLTIALAAVIAPLLVLLGLRHGTIETLRTELVEDPVFRELRPLQSREFSPEWFAAVRDWPDVGFLVPTILPLSSVVQARHPTSGAHETLDLVPTAAGDPLLLGNGGVVPTGDEVVLTAEAARALGVGVGETLRLRVTRAQAGRAEIAESALRVVAVLDPRAGTLPRLYAPLDFVLDVEAYKEGYAAAQRSWPGSTPEPYLSFDGAVLLLPEPLTGIERTGLIINTGFARIDPIDAQGVRERLGFTPPAALNAYHLSAPGATLTPTNLRAIEGNVRGRNAILLPWAAVTFDAAPGLRLIGLSVDERQAQALGIEATPWGGFTGRANPPERLRSVLLPASDPSPPGVLVASGIQPVAVTLEPIGRTRLDAAVVPSELLGVLRTATQRAISIDAASGAFRMARGGYRGFRLYAGRIDAVPALHARLRALGIETHAAVEAIGRIQVLDAGLRRLFWLIASLGIGGGTAVLIASLYAAVERRRRDLGMLRLLGLARRQVFFFPVVQGTVIAVAGLLGGFAGYASLALAINRTFADALDAGQRFCALPLQQVPAIVLITLALAVGASLVAAWRTTRIDPAEVIRDQ
jgi:putative ABC transport system permease protein